MQPRFVITVLLAIVMLLCLPLAAHLERKRRAIDGDTHSYIWGYCFGVASIVVGCLVSTLLIYGGVTSESGGLDVAAIGLALGAITFVAYAVTGWYVIQRHRWAWVTLTILSWVPLLWIINYVYGKHRWLEFSPAAARKVRPAR